MGGQFYSAWHANYDDILIITGKDFLETLLEEGTEDADFDHVPLPYNAQEKARRLKVEPVIEFEGDVAKVKIITL